MLQAIVGWSLHNRVAVVVFALLLLAAGCYASWKAKLDVFPEFAPPQVVIQTEAPGLSPADVERLVTQPIENAVNGLPRLDALRSQSIPGLSVVTVVFTDGTDIYRARQLVNERLAELAGQFPAGVKAPRMAPLTSATGRLLTVGFTARPLDATDYAHALPAAAPSGLGEVPWPGLALAGKKYRPVPDAMDLRDAAQWYVLPRLLRIRGVAQVTILGGEVRQFQVQVRPDALAARGLTVNDVIDATRQASGVRGAGFLENSQQRLTLRVESQVKTAAELGETLVAPSSSGAPVKLKDVGRVTDGAEPKFGDAAIDGGGPAVLLIVYKQFDADTPEVTSRVEEELQAVERELAGRGIAYHPALFRQATFIEHAVGNVATSLAVGAALVCAVLFLFLFNLRVAAISLTAIPLSLLSAVLVLWAFGVSLNTLTLGGLAIAVGEVVDDAIIDVENIYRRLQQNAALLVPRPALEVVLAASLEVRSAVVYATFIVVLVFVPVFFLSGLQGRLFAPLGYAYVLAVLASLATALTVSPALALMLLRGRAAGKGEAHQPPVLRWLQNSYDWLLRLLDREWLLVGGVTLLLIAAVPLMVSQFEGRLLPELRESHFVVHMRGLPGSSLPQTMAMGNRVADDMAAVRGVRSVAQLAGRAELGEDTWGVEYSEFEVDLKPQRAADAAQAQKELDERLRPVPGYSFEVLPFLSERIKETLSGTPAAVVVKVYDDDLDALDRKVQDIAAVLKKVPGADGVRPEPQVGAPEIVIRPRPDAMARFGLRNAQILDALHAAYAGADSGQVFVRNRVVDLNVILAPEVRQTPQEVGELWLAVANPDPATDPAAAKGRVQLKQVADVYLSDGRFLVTHEGSRRKQQVTCNFRWDKAGGEIRDLEAFVAEAEKRVAALKLPPGSYEFTGEHQARLTAQRELLLLSCGVAVAVGLLLWMAFGSLGRMLLVLVNVPFALLGGVAAVYASGGQLDVGGLIGFVTLFGITTRNGIMMVSHWQHLHDVEGVAWGPELIFRGARERLAPVLMTALVTGLGLLPIALGSGEAGREIEGPMALVILCGLISSTALNLLVLPVLYRRVSAWRTVA
jgi:CzcA family heavy metal efflux pump